MMEVSVDSVEPRHSSAMASRALRLLSCAAWVLLCACSDEGAWLLDGGAPPPNDGGVNLGDVLVAPETGADVDAAAATDTGADVASDSGAHVCNTIAPKDCSPGSGTGQSDQCFNGPSCFVTNVQKAVQAVIQAHPSWFDFNNQWNCPRILDVPSFMNAVVAHLVGQGLCAIRDPNAPDEEVTVKHDNAFSENFDLVASNGCARYGSLIYTGWCSPAWW